MIIILIVTNIQIIVIEIDDKDREDTTTQANRDGIKNANILGSHSVRSKGYAIGTFGK